MKLRYARATGCPAGQFVIEAESEEDRIILEQFLRYQYKKKWKFWLHGAVSDYDGKRSFNFGFIKK